MSVMLLPQLLNYGAQSISACFFAFGRLAQSAFESTNDACILRTYKQTPAESIRRYAYDAQLLPLAALA